MFQDFFSASTHALTQQELKSIFENYLIQSNLHDSKNLLAFSAGVDSVALFFLLLEARIPFDIAIVHYHTRIQADDEVVYAKELATRFNKHCFIAHAPQFTSGFEQRAREFRFGFFESLIVRYGYTRLLLAHQLNDRVEWLFMRLAHGSGLGNLLGFEERREAGEFAYCIDDGIFEELYISSEKLSEERQIYLDSKSVKKKYYEVCRPLQAIPKTTLKMYCATRKLRYFEDESNMDKRFLRNYFRHEFCERFVNEFSYGIMQSLTYLERDYQSLSRLIHTEIFNLSYLFRQLERDGKCTDLCECYFRIYMIRVENYDENVLMLGCDKVFKQCGYVLSASQRSEIVKSMFNCQIAHILVTRNPAKPKGEVGIVERVYIVPNLLGMYKNVTKISMPKDFRQFCAQENVSPRLRGILFAEFSAWILEKYALTLHAWQAMKKAERYAIYQKFRMRIRNFFTL